MSKRANLYAKIFLAAAVVLSSVVFYSCQTFTNVVSVGTAVLAVAGGVTGVIDSNTASAIIDSSASVAAAAEEVSPQQEYYLGRAVAGTLLKNYGAYQNETATEYLNYVCHVLTVNSPQPELYKGYYVQILDSNEINAFGTSGGHILVTKGLIQNVKSEDEIAAVLAHEIAHIQLKHSIKAIKSSRTTDAVFKTSGAVLTALTDGDDNTVELIKSFDSTVGKAISNMVDKGYSQDNEFAADKYALSLLDAAGYDVHAMDEMLEMLGQKSKAKSGFGKTHPKPKKRIKNLSKEYKKYASCKTQSMRTERFEEVWSVL